MPTPSRDPFADLRRPAHQVRSGRAASDESIHRVAKYQQVVDRITAAIRAGELRPGEQLLPEVDLAAEHGVSRVTVRAALKLLEERGLIERRHGAGTFVRNGVNGVGGDDLSPRQVAFVFVDFPSDHPYSVYQLAGAESVLSAKGYGLTWSSLTSSDVAAGRLPPGLSRCAGIMVDGPVQAFHLEFLERVGVPVLTMSGYELPEQFNTVAFALAEPVRDAVSRLVRQFERPVAPVLPPLHKAGIRQVLVGYQEAVRNLPAIQAGAYLCEDGDEPGIVASLAHHFREGFGVLTSMAHVEAILRAYHEQGIDERTHPILAYGMSDWINPAIAGRFHGLIYDPAELAGCAAELLIGMIEGGTKHVRQHLPLHRVTPAGGEASPASLRGRPAATRRPHAPAVPS